jgi:hypothetical protein
MRIRHLRRRRRLLYVVLVGTLAALAGAGAMLASAEGPAAQSSPEPEAQAPAPLSGYQPASGPPLGDERIAQIARAASAQAGESAPSMTAVNATLKLAIEARPGNEPLESTPQMAALQKSEVVVVTLKGHFKLTGALPRGSSLPAGSVLTLTIDARSGWIDTRELSADSPPGLAALGRARALS